jgi:hypothetical protein
VDYVPRASPRGVERRSVPVQGSRWPGGDGLACPTLSGQNRAGFCVPGTSVYALRSWAFARRTQYSGRGLGSQANGGTERVFGSAVYAPGTLVSALST